MILKLKNYFKSGDEKDLKPMKLDDVAAIVGMDRSTVSRVTNSKSVETFFGVISLKNLFSQAYFKDNGEVVSTKKIKNFYFFQIGRWDLELKNDKIIKFPNENVEDAIIKSIELLNRQDFENYNIIDLRVEGKIIVE